MSAPTAWTRLVPTAIDGSLTRRDVEGVAAEGSRTSADVYNALLTHVAREFLAGRLGFWNADAAANTVWVLITDEMSDFGHGYPMPQPAFDIFEAFDAGEYDHGDGTDPIESITKPRLRQILDSSA